MKFGSVCSGIEAASCAWHPLGWRAQWLSEIEAFPSAVLAHHYPTVPNLGDMTKFKEWPNAAIDLLVGGTPCQSFSVAGLRKGLADPRGNLMLTYLAIAERFAPRWLVWENVPGVLSSNGGRDFGTLLGGLAELGYGFAYRILDAQHFGVPQRRRRVFVVGHLGDWRPAAAVLFERESLLGHPAPRRETGKGITRAIAPSLTSSYGKQPDSSDTNAGPMLIPMIAPTLSARTKGGGGLGTDFECDGGLIPQVARALTTSNQRIDAETETETETLLVAQALNIRGREGGGTAELSGDVATALRASQGGGDKLHAMIGSAVRRLTPCECERLQGFPDDYTAITVRGKPAADGPRYKALGNSMAVPVMAWLGSRIQLAEETLN
jgi:DNA (cytosine-5)-methyltransferase 1